MTALRRIATALAALLLLLGASAYLVPPWLDWTRYREDVAALAGAALGQPVRIDGGITLRLLPQPLLLAERIAVDGPAPVTAEQLVLRIALPPLLAGRVDARELVLRGADIRLPWPLDPTALALRTPTWLSALSARIERGRLRVGEVEVTNLNATLATSDLSGSFLTAGRARGGGRDWVFTARISRPGGDGAVGIDITLDGQGPVQGLGAVVAAQMQSDGTALGRITLRGPDLAALVPAPPTPFRLEGRLSAGGGLVAADELVGDLAGSPVTGAIALRLLPQLRLDLALAAGRLDLDAWAPAVLRGAAIRHPLPVGLDLSVESAPWAGGTLRGLRAALDLADGAIDLRDARATLPGDAALRLSGRLAPDRGFTGQATLDAPTLRPTLAWAAAAGLAPAAAPPPGVLGRARLTAAVTLEDGEAVLSDLAGEIDGAETVALLAWRPAPSPGRATLRAIVTTTRLDLDPWLAAPAPTGLSLDLRLNAEQATWRGATFAPLAVDLAAEPGRLTLRSLEAQTSGATLAAAGTWLDGARPEPARLDAARLDLRADRAETLEPALRAALPAAWAAPWLARLAPLLTGPAQLQLQAAGPLSALGLKLTAAIGDLRAEASPTLDLPRATWSGPLALRHPGAPRLAERLGLPGAIAWLGATAWLGEGSLGLVAQLAATPEHLAAQPFTLTAGGLRAAGALRLDLGPVPRLSGRIAAETLPLPLPVLRDPDPLPLAALRGWTAQIEASAARLLLAQDPALTDATTTITLADGTLRLTDLRARLAGGALTGSLALATSPAQPPALSAELALRGARLAAPLFDLPLDLTGGTLDAALRLTAAGFSPAGLLASLDGEASLTARDGVLAGFDLIRMGTTLAEPDLRAALAGGATGFDRLDLAATLSRGALVLTRATLASPGGRAEATGGIDLTRALLALRLALHPAVPDPPELGLRLSGPLDAPVRIPELAPAVPWRAARPK
jgi:hypothetical protein